MKLHHSPGHVIGTIRRVGWGRPRVAHAYLGARVTLPCQDHSPQGARPGRVWKLLQPQLRPHCLILFLFIVSNNDHIVEIYHHH